MRKPGFSALLVFAALMAGTATGASGAGELTDADRKTLVEGRIGKADYVLMHLRQEYERSGPEVLKPAVPALLTGAQKFLHKPEDLGEEDEIIGDYIWLLCKTGDPRTRQFFLELMVNDRVGGLMVAEGLLSLGKSVLPAIEDSLSSPRAKSRYGTAGYLVSMIKMDSKGEFFTLEDRKRISKRLLTLLADTDDLVRTYTAINLISMVKMDSKGEFFTPEDRKRISKCLLLLLADKDDLVRTEVTRALGETGDLSYIPALEKVRENDSYKSPDGIFVIRELAARSIEWIKKREIQAK